MHWYFRFFQRKNRIYIGYISMIYINDIYHANPDYNKKTVADVANSTMTSTTTTTRKLLLLLSPLLLLLRLWLGLQLILNIITWLGLILQLILFCTGVRHQGDHQPWMHHDSPSIQGRILASILSCIYPGFNIFWSFSGKYAFSDTGQSSVLHVFHHHHLLLPLPLLLLFLHQWKR